MTDATTESTESTGCAGRDVDRMMAENIDLGRKACWHYRRYWGSLDEEEAMSVALLAYVRACRGFDPARGCLSTYVYSAVRRAFWEEYQRGTRRPAPVECGALAAWTPAAPPPRPFLDEQVLDLMPAEVLECVAGRLAGETMQEIGARMGITRQGVNVRLGRAQAVMIAAGLAEPDAGSRVSGRRSDVLARVLRTLRRVGDCRTLKELGLDMAERQVARAAIRAGVAPELEWVAGSPGVSAKIRRVRESARG